MILTTASFNPIQYLSSSDTVAVGNDVRNLPKVVHSLILNSWSWPIVLTELVTSGNVRVPSYTVRSILHCNGKKFPITDEKILRQFIIYLILFQKFTNVLSIVSVDPRRGVYRYILNSFLIQSARCSILGFSKAAEQCHGPLTCSDRQPLWDDGLARFQEQVRALKVNSA